MSISVENVMFGQTQATAAVLCQWSVSPSSTKLLGEIDATVRAHAANTSQSICSSLSVCRFAILVPAANEGGLHVLPLTDGRCIVQRQGSPREQL